MEKVYEERERRRTRVPIWRWMRIRGSILVRKAWEEQVNRKLIMLNDEWIGEVDWWVIGGRRVICDSCVGNVNSEPGVKAKQTDVKEKQQENVKSNYNAQPCFNPRLEHVHATGKHFSLNCMVINSWCTSLVLRFIPVWILLRTDYLLSSQKWNDRMMKIQWDSGPSQESPWRQL